MDLDGDGNPDKVPPYVMHSIYIMAIMSLFALVGAFLGHATYNLVLGDGTGFPRDIAIGAVVSLLTIVGINQVQRRKSE